MALAACAPFPAQPATITGTGATAAWARLGDAGGKKTIAIVFASWCVHCHDELAQLDQLRARPDLRIVGVNFKWQEEYDARGDSAAVRAYVAEYAPWLTVVPGDGTLYGELGDPAKVPSVYVFDAAGGLVASFDRRRTQPPDAHELAGVLDGIR